MPRGPRFDAPGYRHHVMNRGAGHATVFVDDDDVANFLDLIDQAVYRFGIRIHGYALMTDHFHLMIETPRGQLSKAMAFVLGRYTRLFNMRHNSDGPIFRGRFKSRLVETTDYWRHLLAYLHLNPVRAKIVAKPEDSYLTSCRAYYGLQHGSPSWLTTDQLTDLFGSREQLVAYAERVRTGNDDGASGFDPVSMWDVAPAPNIVVESNDISVEAALAELTMVIGEYRHVVVDGARAGNPKLWITAWWLYMRTGMSLRAVGKRYKVLASTASRWVVRLWRHADKNPEVAGWLATLNAKLTQVNTPVL